MLINVKKSDDGFVIYDSNSNIIKSFSDEESASNAAKSLNDEINKQVLNLETIALENGPVVVGVAATNIPHLPLPPVKVIEKDGKKHLRVPFLREGVFRHPKGNLIFNEQIFDKMIQNHKNKKSHYGVNFKLRHQDSGALAWFDEDLGGSITKEHDDQYGNILVGYGEPTSQKALDVIESKEYLYASVEFKPNHKDVKLESVGFDNLVEISLEELINYDELLKEEPLMSDVTIALDEYNGLKDDVASKANKIKELETKITELEAELKEEDVLELPEEVKLEIEQKDEKIRKLQSEKLDQEIELIIQKAKAYRDGNGKGHSPILLEVAEAAMKGKALKVNEQETIELESNDTYDTAKYFRNVIQHMLKVVPGQVNLETKTEGDEKGDEGKDYDFPSFWAEGK